MNQHNSKKKKKKKEGSTKVAYFLPYFFFYFGFSPSLLPSYSISSSLQIHHLLLSSFKKKKTKKTKRIPEIHFWLHNKSSSSTFNPFAISTALNLPDFSHPNGCKRLNCRLMNFTNPNWADVPIGLFIYSVFLSLPFFIMSFAPVVTICCCCCCYCCCCCCCCSCRCCCSWFCLLLLLLVMVDVLAWTERMVLSFEKPASF